MSRPSPDPAPPAASPTLRDVLADGLAGADGRLCWGLAVVVAVGDVVLTAQGVSAGLVESNPVAAWALGVGGVGGLVLLKGLALAVGVCGWLALPGRARAIAPLGLALPWTVAVAVNGWLLYLA